MCIPNLASFFYLPMDTCSIIHLDPAFQWHRMVTALGRIPGLAELTEASNWVSRSKLVRSKLIYLFLEMCLASNNAIHWYDLSLLSQLRKVNDRLSDDLHVLEYDLQFGADFSTSEASPCTYVVTMTNSVSQSPHAKIPTNRSSTKDIGHQNSNLPENGDLRLHKAATTCLKA